MVKIPKSARLQAIENLFQKTAYRELYTHLLVEGNADQRKKIEARLEKMIQLEYSRMRLMETRTTKREFLKEKKGSKNKKSLKKAKRRTKEKRIKRAAPIDPKTALPTRKMDILRRFIYYNPGMQPQEIVKRLTKSGVVVKLASVRRERSILKKAEPKRFPDFYKTHKRR